MSLWPVLFVSVTNCLTHSKESYSAIKPHTQSDGMHCNKHTLTLLHKTDEERQTHREVSERERDTLLLILDFLASLHGFLFLRSLPSLRPSAPPISSHHTLIRHTPSHLSPCLLLLVLSLSLSLHTLTSRRSPARSHSLSHARTRASVRCVMKG